MLARVAERMYWFGRYLERTENIARLINVNTNLALDLPKVKHIWGSMIDITGTTTEFGERFTRLEERNVVKFLLDDEHHSIQASIRRARENARTTREIIPTETWEMVNELHIYVRQNLDKGLTRAGRHRFLTGILSRCQQVNGLLSNNMSENAAHYFIRIGRNLERADMTTRIVDVGCLNLMQPDADLTEYENILWMNVLLSLSAYQMYRQHVLDTVNGEDVVDFLIKDDKFPRAVSSCLTAVQNCCERLPKNDPALRTVNHVRRVVAGSDVIDLLKESKLHEFIDDLQQDLADIHNSVANNWFGHEPYPIIKVEAEAEAEEESET